MSVIRRRTPVTTDEVPARPDDGGRRRRGRREATPGRRVARGALIVAAVTAALSLAGPFALRPFSDVAGAAGEVTVAFVLDFGGSSSNQVVGCVTVPSTDSRYDALAAFISQENLAPAVYAPSGLLCSINGIPSSGCGQTVAGGYIYWSYFTGGSTGWVYSSTGAFGNVTHGDVEGWRFQDPGTGRPNDPPPRTAPEYDALCATTPTTTTTTTTAPPKHGGGGGTTGTGSGGTTGAGPTTTVPVTHARHPAKSTGTSAPVAGGSGTSSSTTSSTSCPSAASTSTPTSTTTSVASDPSRSTSSTTTTTSDPCSPTDSTLPTGASDSSDSSGTVPTVSVPADPEVGLATVAHHAPSGPGPDPLIVGGLLVAVLAIAAYTRWRKRTRTS